jgi:hypothetical protein
MSDDLLDTEIEPAHQALAARLTLASVDADAHRIDAGLSEVVEGGMSTAVAVIALLSKHLGVSLLTAHGAEKTRAMLERTILDASSGKPCRVKVPMWGWLRPSRPEGVRAEPAGMTTPATAVVARH